MAKRDVEQLIADLGRLRAGSPDAAAAPLRKGLADRINLVSAKAAQLAGDLRIKSLVPDLLAAFDRFFRDGGAQDPQCWAKNAIAKALTDLEHDESAIFLRGCRYVQMEASWGGKTDTAVTLRSLCTLALVQCADLSRIQKLRHLVTSLTDSAETVRIDSIRAIEQMEGDEAALLLRLKAGAGDAKAAVCGQALESLLRVEGEDAVDFARAFLDSPEEEIVEEAALALGASRLPRAVVALQEAWRTAPLRVFLQAISVSRQESGFEFLLDLIQTAREPDAAAAIRAIAIHQSSPDVRSRVASVIAGRESVELKKEFITAFPPG